MDIYKNFTFFRSLLRWERKKEEKGAGEGEVSDNEELIDIQNLNYQNYVNSQIILPAKKLTNSERQARDGGRHSEERCIFEAQTTAPEGLHAIICLMQIGTLWWNGVATIFINDKKHPKRPLLTQIQVDSFRTLCRPNDKSYA